MFEIFFGKTSEQKFADMEIIKDRILARQESFRTLSDTDLRNVSLNLKNQIRAKMKNSQGERISNEERQEVLDSYLIDAFALAKEAVKREHGFELHDVQVIGGIALHNGEVAQLATGEGKTLMAALPAYLNALTGDGVHVITPNAYLAQRDAQGNGKIYSRLGLSTGFVPSGRSQDKMDQIKEAYNSDITYAASADLGFNYLHDGLALNREGMVNDSSRYTYAIVDEVDSVLLDDAVTPLTISGVSEADRARDIKGAIASIEENYLEESRRAALADDAIYRIYSLDIQKQNEFHRTGGKSSAEPNLVYRASSTEEYNLVVNNRFEKKIAQSKLDSYALIVDKSTGNYRLTELGERIISKYYIGKDIEKAFFQDLNQMLTIRDINGQQKYKYNEDFYIVKSGDVQQLQLTEHGYEKVLRDRDSKRINDIYDGHKFAINFSEDLHNINNSIKAYWTFKANEDYVLSSFEDGPDYTPDFDCQKLTIVMGGRTEEGRVYSDGLQLALEKKEMRLAANERRVSKNKPVKIVETKSTPELASISQSMFYNIYANVGGMTGTSAKESFEMMYKWATTELPKNVEYEKIKAQKEGRQIPAEYISYAGKRYVKPSGLQAVKDELFFDYVDQNGKQVNSEDAKIDRLIEELTKSIRKGQPVLISTTSVKESINIHQKLRERLRIDVPLLNANTKNEADIISRAGKFGSITISTEMSGRGTDIKLAGEMDTKVFQTIFTQLAKEKFVAYAKANGIDLRNSEVSKIAQRQYIEREMDNIRYEATMKWHEDHKLEKDRIMLAGGLKVIGLGHFKYDRVDRQLIGRTARQGDPGEAVFLSSEKDMRDINLYPREYKKLIERAQKNGETSIKGREFEELVKDKQSFNEMMAASSIKQSLDSEKIIQDIRVQFRKQQDELKKTQNFAQVVDFMIEKSVEQLIIENSLLELHAKTKLSKSKIDMNKLREDARKYLNIELPERIRASASVKDLALVMARGAQAYHQNVVVKNLTPAEYQHKFATEIMDMFGQTWINFQDTVESERRQDMLDSYVKYDQRSKIEHRIPANYNQVVRESRFNIASFMLTGKKTTYYEDKRDKKLQEETAENIEVAREQKPIKNFYARQAASVLAFTTSVNKGMPTAAIANQDDMVSVRFK